VGYTKDDRQIYCTNATKTKQSVYENHVYLSKCTNESIFDKRSIDFVL